MYGGANSHMAIRCAEFGLPAAVGVGTEVPKTGQSTSNRAITTNDDKGITLERLKIAVSQNVYQIPDRATREGLDTRLSTLLWELGFNPLPLSSNIKDTSSYLYGNKPRRFILSGGNDIGSIPERDQLETAILVSPKVLNALYWELSWYANDKSLSKGTCIKVNGHASSNHFITGLITGYSNRTVNSYHNYGIKSKT